MSALLERRRIKIHGGIIARLLENKGVRLELGIRAYIRESHS